MIFFNGERIDIRKFPNGESFIDSYESSMIILQLSYYKHK